MSPKSQQSHHKVTGRHYTGETVEKSIEHFQALFGNLLEGVQILDHNWRYLYLNTSAERHNRRPNQELLGRKYMEMWPDIEETFVFTVIEHCMKDRVASRLENRFVFPDGTVGWFLLSIQPIPEGVLILSIDISERVRAEIQEERYRFLFENNPHPMWLYDLKTLTFLAVNDAAVEKYGYTREEFLQMTIADIRPAEDVSRLIETVSKPRSGLQHSGEWRHRLKDGTIINVEIKSHTLQLGNQNSALVVVQDITEGKRAQEAMRDSQMRLSSIIDSAMDAIISLDADQRIILFNPAAEQMFGCAASEAIGQSLDRFIPDRLRDIHRKHIRNFGQTGLTKRSMGALAPLTCLRADGEEFPAEITISQTTLAEEKIYTAILRDITERMHAEEKVNRKVGELTALYQTTLDIISSHDLPILLNTIVARAVDLLGGTSGGLYRCEPEKKQVRCAVSYKTPEDYTGTVLAYGEGAAGTVAATGEPLIIDDYRSWKGRARAYEAKQPFSAVISAPMLWQGQVTGVIHVMCDTEERKFTEEDLKLLTSFANQAAIAVENARLLEETQRRLERLSILRQIDQVITNSLDLRVTLNILLGHILQQLEVDAATVLLYQPELQRLEFVAGQGFRTRALQSTYLRLGQGFAGRAALEQRIVQVSDLSQMQTGFLRSPEFHNEGFVAYLGVPLIAKGRITGVLEIYHRRPLDFEQEWMSFLEILAGQAAIAIDNIRLFEDLQSTNMQLLQAYDATIEGWAKALELREMEVEGHSKRVVEMTLELARKMGVRENQLTHIRWGALLHDIGKMGVLDAILQKPAALTEAEWELMRQHPLYAYEWLAPILYLKPALDIPYCHHEKWDGTGYPRGLKGEQIPLAARIFAVVDVWDALTSDRPYRPAWTKEKTLEYIKEQAGRSFDPSVVEVFLKTFAADETIAANGIEI